MEFTISRDEFQKALQRAQGVASTKGQMPILSNILLEASEQGVWFYSTNLNIGLKGKYEAAVKAPGKTTVIAKKLYDIVRELPDGDIDVKVDDDNRLRVVSGKSRFDLPTIDPADFPSFPEYEESSFIGLEVEMLSEMIRKTKYAISQDETRMTLNGALLELSPSKVKMVATDGHRLTLVEREGAFKVEGTEKSIIAKKAIDELSKLLTEGEEPLKLFRRDNHIVFERGSLALAIRLIEGAYPNYDQVIPKEFSNEANISAPELVHGLRRVATLANEKSHMIRMTFSQGKLELRSEGGEIGEAKDEIAIDFTGEGMAIGLNAYYLLDILQIIDNDTIRLRMQNQHKAIQAESPGDEGMVCIVMPMRL